MSTSNMRHLALVEQIRAQVREIFASKGVASDSEIRETILIRSGYYCGRRFEADGAHAIWFCEENLLKFYGADGSVERSVPFVPDAPTPASPAAPTSRVA